MAITHLKWYDDELDYYFIIRVQTGSGTRYAYNQRTLVCDIDFAKRFDTRRSAKRCIRLSEYKEYEIIKVERSFGKQQREDYS